MPSSDFTYNYRHSPPSYRALPCRRTTKLQRQILARYPPNHRLSGCQQSDNNDEIEDFFTGYEDEDDTILFSVLEEAEEVQNNNYNDDDACLVLQSSFEAVLVEDDVGDNHDVMPSIRKENSSFGCSVSTCSITSYSDDTISIGSTATNLSGRVFVVEEETMEKRMDYSTQNNNNNRRTNKQSHTITSPNQTTTKLKRPRSKLQRQLSSKFLKRNTHFNSSKSREVQDFFTTKGIEIVLVEEDEDEGHTLASSTSSRRRHKVIDDEKVVRNGFYYDTYYVSSRSRTITGQ